MEKGLKCGYTVKIGKGLKLGNEHDLSLKTNKVFMGKNL
jgi:hypothetical protein